VNASLEYARTRVSTASGENVLLLLLDAARARVRAGVELLERGEPTRAVPLLCSASDIVVELRSSLRRTKAPDVADNLGRVYEFVALRLARAAATRSAAPAREAEKALLPVVDAFHAAVATLHGAR